MALAVPTQLVLASGNAGKLRELAALCTPLGIEVIAQASLGVEEAEEPYLTFVENALVKARSASRHTGLAALADDSGLCVDALHGAPGVHSARFAGEPRSDARNIEKLLALLQDNAVRNAYFYCVLVLVRRHDDPTPLIVEGRWYGTIGRAVTGQSGFGYDPVFMIDSLGKSAAELAPEHKNQISHRALAMRQLLQALGH